MAPSWFYKPVHETLELLYPYDLIVVEEVSQTVESRSLNASLGSGKPPKSFRRLVFVGDFYQLPGVEQSSPLQSGLWNSVMVKKRYLKAMRRCKCPKLLKTLDILRSNKPSVEQLRMITRGHKAPSLQRAGYVMNKVPSLDDVRHILEETPRTMFLTVTRKGAAYLNDLAVQVLFPWPDVDPMAVLPADPESNIENFYKGKMIRGGAAGGAHLQGGLRHPLQELEQGRRLREWHGRNGAWHGRQEECRGPDRSGQGLGSASLDFGKQGRALPVAAWLRQYFAQSSGRHAFSRDRVVGRAQLPSRGLCCHQPGGV